MINKKGKAKHCVAILHEKEMIFRAKIKYVKTTSWNNLKRIYNLKFKDDCKSIIVRR